MFDHHCPACGKRQLLFPSQITGIVNDEQGIVVLLTCWCGEPAAVRTGRAPRPADARTTRWPPDLPNKPPFTRRSAGRLGHAGVCDVSRPGSRRR